MKKRLWFSLWAVIFGCLCLWPAAALAQESPVPQTEIAMIKKAHDTVKSMREMVEKSSEYTVDDINMQAADTKAVLDEYIVFSFTNGATPNYDRGVIDSLDLAQSIRAELDQVPRILSGESEDTANNESISSFNTYAAAFEDRTISLLREVGITDNEIPSAATVDDAGSTQRFFHGLALAASLLAVAAVMWTGFRRFVSDELDRANRMFAYASLAPVVGAVLAGFVGSFVQSATTSSVLSWVIVGLGIVGFFVLIGFYRKRLQTVHLLRPVATDTE